MNCNVFLVDDHNLVRVALRGLLERLEGVQVIGEAEDGRAAVEQALRLSPDLVLLDVDLPVLNGIEVLIQLKRSRPELRIMMLSMYDNQETVIEALRAGACGYLLKGAQAVELELALGAAMRGERYLSPQISKPVLDRLLNPVPDAVAVEAASLTQRQTQILALIAQGRAAKEIAFELNLSVKTVESHRAQIMRRLDIHDVAGLVLYAVRQGLIPLEDSCSRRTPRSRFAVST